MRGHQDVLNEVAERNGLPPLTGQMSTATYINYCLDLMMIERGLLQPTEINLPTDDLNEAFDKIEADEYEKFLAAGPDDDMTSLKSVPAFRGKAKPWTRRRKL